MSEGPHRTRVLIADDDAGICRAMTRLLSPECDVVGVVDDIATLCEATVRLQPDVLLLDFSLGGHLNVFELSARLKTASPEMKIVALTADDDADIKRLAYQAGFSGFVWKLLAPEQLLPTILAVVHGQARSAEDETA